MSIRLSGSPIRRKASCSAMRCWMNCLKKNTKRQSCLFELVDRYTTDRHDLDLQHLVKRVYEFSRSHPDPEGWLHSLAELYDAASDTKVEALPFYSYIKEDIALVLEGMRQKLTRALDLTKQPGACSARRKFSR